MPSQSKQGLHITHFPHDFACAYTGHVDNNAGFSWAYLTYMRVEHEDDELKVVFNRILIIQAGFAGYVTQPMRAVMDDYGTLVVVGPV